MNLFSVKECVLLSSENKWSEIALSDHNLRKLGVSEEDFSDIRKKYRRYDPILPCRCYLVSESDNGNGVIMFDSINGRRTFLVVPKKNYQILKDA